METLAHDVRFGVRMLLKNRGFTIVALLALTLGIGANSAIFSVVNAVLLKPLPYPNAERLMRVAEKSPQFDVMSVAYMNYADWRDQSESFEQMAIYQNDGYNLSTPEGAERIQGRRVAADFLSILGCTPAIGRDFVDEDDRVGASPVVITSHGLWQRRFGADPNFVGKTVTLNGTSYTVVGILPASFRVFGPAEVYIPYALLDDMTMHHREFRSGNRVIGRLKPGISVEQARGEMDNIALRLAEQYPDSNTGYGIVVTSMYEDMVGDIRPALLVLLGAVGFVLLIACANVANLLLARAAARQREIAIRTALGAGRVRIVRQLLTESVVLSFVGGVMGLLLALWGNEALISAIPDTLPRAEAIGIDIRVLGFTLAVSLVTGIIFGLAPAVQASKPDLNESLKEGGRGTTGGRHRVRSGLVISEVALALVLLIGAGLMIRSIFLLSKVAPGFDPHNLVTMEVALTSTAYSDPSKIRSFYEQLLERLKPMPGIEAASVTTDLPMVDDSEVPLWTGGGPPPAQQDMSWALIYSVSPGYLNAMKIPLLKGRFIAAQDTEKTPTVAVIDEKLAQGLFPGDDPIGKWVSFGAIAGVPEIRCEIIGAVGHIKHWGLDTDAQSKIQYQFYMPYRQIPDPFLPLIVSGMKLLVRSNADPLSIAAAVKSQVHTLDREQPVYGIRTMDQLVAASTSQRRFSMLLLGIFASVALVLAAIGIYGVMSYSVTQRSHEIGVRLALGAGRSDVLRLVVGQGMILALAGVSVGLIAAFALTRVMSNLLFGVSATDLLTFASISVLLTGVALGACFVPARRATKVDPMVALRYE